MRNKLLSLCLIIASCTLCSCSSNSEQSNMTKQVPDVVISETEVFDDSTIEGKDYIWTEENKIKLEENLKSCNFLNFTQSTKNMSAENNSIYTFMNYIVQVDANTKVSKVTITSGDNVQDGFSKDSYVSDLINDLYYELDNNVWVEAKNQTKELSWNLKDLKNGYEMINNLYDLSLLEVNTVGKLEDKYAYFVLINESQEDAVFGINYSSLGENKTTIIIDTESMLPVSIINDIEYKLEDKDYIVQSSIIFEEINSDKMTLESLGINLPEGFVKSNG